MLTIQPIEPASIERRLARYFSSALVPRVGTGALLLADGPFPREWFVHDPEYPRPAQGTSLLPLYLCDPESRQAWALYVFVPERRPTDGTPTPLPDGVADQLLAQARALGIPARARQWAMRTKPVNYLARLARTGECL
jgi:hypothetical protein